MLSSPCQIRNCASKIIPVREFPMHPDRFRHWARQTGNRDLIDRLKRAQVWQHFTVCQRHFERKFRARTIKSDGKGVPGFHIAGANEVVYSAASARRAMLMPEIEDAQDLDLPTCILLTAQEMNRYLDQEESSDGEEEEDNKSSIELQVYDDELIEEFRNLIDECENELEVKNQIDIDDFIKSETVSSNLEGEELKIEADYEPEEIFTLDHFNEICRTCHSRSNEFKYINDVFDDNISVTFLLENYVSIQVDEQDILPLQICNNCIDELLRFHTFRMKCEENEAVLARLKEEAFTIMEQEAQEEIVETEEFISADPERDPEAEPEPEPKPQRQTEPIAIKCRDCDEEFDSKQAFVEHKQLTGHSKPRQLPCPTCGDMVTDKQMKRHLKIHNGERGVYKCDVCDREFTWLGNLQRHKKVHLVGKTHLCEICGKGYTQKSTLNTHYKQCHNDISRISNYLCTICGKYFETVSGYSLHLLRHNKNYKPPPKRTTPVRKKQKKPNVVKENRCPMCNVKFDTRQLLTQHRMTSHDETKFPCTVCGRRFHRRPLLIQHMKVHTGEKNYQCGVCYRSFTQAPHLKMHMRVHTGERPHSCPYCGKAFALKGNLKVHVRIHTGEKPYACQICGKRFHELNGFKKHRRDHMELEEAEETVEIYYE